MIFQGALRRDAPAPQHPVLRPPVAAPVDARGRPLRDLRISVTDKCNFRCTYCMPRAAFGPDYPFLPHAALLSFEEIARLARIFAGQGVRKFRLTGGEPLLRRELERLVAMLATIETEAGKPVDLTLTTNGSLLARKARALKNAGLKRITVSLDALDPALFATLSDSAATVDDVLRGIDSAAAAGLAPVKINVVVRRGLNEHQILPIARRFRHTGHVVRFIEYMDVGTKNQWRLEEVVTGDEILALVHREFPLEPLPSNYPGEVATRWRYADGAGEIGVITSISKAFCGDCNRARLSPEGRLFLCLFANQGHDLRELLRNGTSDDAIAHRIHAIWTQRSDAYSEQRGRIASGPRIEMSYIGG